MTKKEPSKINKKNIDDFSKKLRQKSAINFLKDYINWQKKVLSGEIDIDDFSFLPKFGPLFINLDLTTACSYNCLFCVDSKIINTGRFFTYKQIKKTIDTLCGHGLKSVLLIGGGEPTLHPDFGNIIKYLKKKKLQVGIVTNGSLMKKIIETSDSLGKGDWLRLSLDAGSNKIFQALHRPKMKVSLDKICQEVSELKALNRNLLIGFSFVITWEGIEINGVKLPSNIEDIPSAAKLAKKSGFDYISFKPCLFKVSDVESLFYYETEEFKKYALKRIKNKIEEAEKIANEKFKIVITKNLKAIFDGKFSEFRSQSPQCHIQIFRQVLTPTGVYHCPAYRGFKRAKIGEAAAFLTEKAFRKTVSENYKNLTKFNPQKQCQDIVCFYNQVNRWIEDFIKSNRDTKEIEICKDDNFFI